MTNLKITTARLLAAILPILGLHSATAGEPMAHDPQFDNREIWPEWVQKTDFVKQEWPAGRMLVWAHAGETTRGADLSDPANWLEDGKPATAPPDENTDLVFPSGKKRYNVGGTKGCIGRHLTIEAGVIGFLKSITLHGNMWVKNGGSWQAVTLRGPANTFMRNDDPKPNQAANKIAFNKPPENSTEWVGVWRLGDELDLFSGRFIVAPDSTFLAGDRSTQHIYPKSKLVLLSGSTFQKRAMQYGFNEMEIVGEVLAGTPERPLTKDCTLGISWKPKGVGQVHNSKEGDNGLILYPEGRIAVHSADPKTARLVFKMNELPAQSWTYEGKDEAAFKALPQGIEMILLGKTEFNGVEFTDLLKGGVAMPDPAARKAWQNVSFGEGNLGSEDELFTKYTGSMDIKMKETGIAKGLAEKDKEDK